MPESTSLVQPWNLDRNVIERHHLDMHGRVEGNHSDRAAMT